MYLNKSGIIVLSILIIGIAVLALAGLWVMTGTGSPAGASESGNSSVAVTGTLASGPDGNVSTRVITDMNGRTVRVPVNITRVYTIPMGGSFSPSFVYVLAPDTLVAWSSGASINMTYFPREYRDLPVVSPSNYEAIVALHPDVVIIESTDPATIETAQQKLGSIPVVSILSWSTCKTSDFGKVLLFLGDLLGVPDKAHIENTYLTTMLNEIATNVSTIPDTDRVRVLYSGMGADGLTPAHIGLPWNQTIGFCGGVDLIGENSGLTSGTSVAVPKESVLKWRPDVIVTTNQGFYSKIYNDDFWKQVPAVQNHRVYLTPSLPVNWFDFPHGVNSIAGYPWAAHIFYPDRFSEDWMKNKDKEFFSTFYHINVTDEEMSYFLHE